MITGPTGWIGLAMLAHLARRFGAGWSSRVALFGSSARMLTAPDGTELPIRPLSALAASDLDGAVVIHLAYLTKEKAESLGERAFTDGNLAIDDLVLGALAGASPHSVFVASSGAAALAEDGRDRHPYGLSKLRQEDRFLAWANASGVPVLVGRIFNIAGPYINKRASYAIAVFIDQARRDKTIRIDARVPVFRSFLHVDNLCAMVVAAGINRLGQSRPVDLCGTETVEMSDIAAEVVRWLGGDIAIIRPDVNYTASAVYVGDSTRTKSLAMALGVALTPFSVQVADTAVWMDGTAA